MQLSKHISTNIGDMTSNCFLNVSYKGPKTRLSKGLCVMLNYLKVHRNFGKMNEKVVIGGIAYNY